MPKLSWHKKPITSISYWDFLPRSKKSLKQQILKFCMSVISEKSKLKTKEQFWKSFLSLPSTGLVNKSKKPSSAYKYSTNISNIYIRDIEHVKVRGIDNNFFESPFHAKIWQRYDKSTNYLAFGYLASSNQEIISYDKREDNEAKISDFVKSDSIIPTIRFLNRCGIKCTGLSEKQVKSPFGDSRHEINSLRPDYVITSGHKQLPIEIKKPFNTQDGIPNEVHSQIIKYLITSNSTFGVVSTYFDTYVYHLSEQDIDSAEVLQNGKVSLSLGIREILNTDEFITPNLALASLILRQTRDYSDCDVKRLIPIFQKKEKEIERDKQKHINKAIKDIEDVMNINLSKEEWLGVEEFRVQSGQCELLNIEKDIFFKHLSVSSKTVAAFQNESKVIIKVLDPLLYCNDMEENLSNVLEKMKAYQQLQLQNFNYLTLHGKSRDYLKYMNEPLGYGFLKLSLNDRIRFCGYCTFHKPALLMSTKLNQEQALKVKKSLNELHKSSIVCLARVHITRHRHVY